MFILFVHFRTFGPGGFNFFQRPISPVFSGFPQRHVANFVHEPQFFGTLGSAPFIYGSGFPVFSPTFRNGPVGYNPITPFLGFNPTLNSLTGFPTARHLGSYISSYLISPFNTFSPFGLSPFGNFGGYRGFPGFGNLGGYSSPFGFSPFGNFAGYAGFLGFENFGLGGPFNIGDYIDNLANAGLMSIGLPPLNSYPIFNIAYARNPAKRAVFNAGTNLVAHSILTSPAALASIPMQFGPQFVSNA